MQKQNKKQCELYFGKIYTLYRRLIVRSVPFHCAALLNSIKAFFPIESALTYIQLPLFSALASLSLHGDTTAEYGSEAHYKCALSNSTGALVCFLNDYYYEFYHSVVVLAQILISELLMLSRTLVKY